MARDREPLERIDVRLFKEDVEYLRRVFPQGTGLTPRAGGGREGGYNAWLRELVRWAIAQHRAAVEAGERGYDGDDEGSR